MSKTKYDQIREEIAAKVNSNSTRYSRSDYVDLTQGLLNSPEQSFSIHMKDKDSKKPTVVAVQPSKKVRGMLERIAVKHFGVDRADAAKAVETVEFSHADAEAFVDVNTFVQKDYIGSGRKFIFPVTTPTESQMEISQVTVPAKSVEVSKIAKNAKGEYERVLTGKRKDTKEHAAIKASNKVPGWIYTIK